jgi:hypothetical protein
VLTDGNDALYNSIFWNAGTGQWQYTQSDAPAFVIRNTGIADTFEIRAFAHGTAGANAISWFEALAINGATGAVGVVGALDNLYD